MRETLQQKALKLIRLTPNPTSEQIREIQKIVPCGERTVYRALEDLRRENMAKYPDIDLDNGKSRKGRPPKKSKEKTPKNPKHKKIKSKKKSKRKNNSNPNKQSITTPKSFLPNSNPGPDPLDLDMTFEKFCRKFAYPYYKGLYRWQYQWFHEVWPHKYSLTKAPRDHGKSIGHGNLCQYVMAIKEYDVLYLGWTNRRREIAEFVYNYFLQRGELVQDKASSPYHFKTTLGTRFDTFSVKSKEILGMHEMGSLEREIDEENEYLKEFVRDSDRKLLMVIDDPIDETFKLERHKEEKLEQFFLSTILNINPDKLMVVGTHKFEGDFLHFLEHKVFKEDLYIYKRRPFLEKNDPRYGIESDNPANLLAPERWIAKEHPQYEKYLELLEMKKNGVDPKTFAPFEKKLIKLKDLTKRRKQVGEYWWGAEYEQDPKAVKGEVWDKLKYKIGLGKLADFTLIVISIDRATTVNSKSDYTGITVFFRNKKGKFVVTNDLTRKIPLSELLPFIQEIYEELVQEYGMYMLIKIVVEKQGGGDDFMDLASAGDYDYADCFIPVHNTRDKKTRILDILGIPIKNGIVSFVESLKNSELISEIETFPNPDKIDALDSLANGVHEANLIPEADYGSDEKKEALQNYKSKQEDETETPFRAMINKHSKYGKKPGVFQ